LTEWTWFKLIWEGNENRAETARLGHARSDENRAETTRLGHVKKPRAKANDVGLRPWLIN
jgi:hypothetical protein